MTNGISRFIYLSTFEYPTKHAHPLHALFMARAFARAFGERFLFVVGASNSELTNVPHLVPFGPFAPILKYLHLRTIMITLWLSMFLLPYVLRRERVVVFTNDLKLAAGASTVRTMLAFDLVVEVHGTANKRTTDSALAAARAVVFVTAGLRDALATSASIAAKSVVIGNAVDVEAFSAGSNDRSMREQIGVGPETFLIGYAGRFKPMQTDKGISFMIQSLAKLSPECQLLLVGGSDREVEDATEEARQLGILDRVHIMPFIPSNELPRYLAACDLLAYVPPRTDTFLETETSPMKLYEYMAARRPILVSDMPTFRSVLGENAYYIAPGAQDEFVEKVSMLRTDPKRTENVESAFQRVAKNSWDARAARIAELV